MVSTIARDFIDVRKQKQLIHGPQLPGVKHYNGLRWSNSGSNLNALADSLQHKCLFFPQNPGFASHLSFRFHTRSRTFVWLLAFWTRVRQLFGNTVVCFSLKIKPSYFPFSHSRTFVLNPQCELFGSLSNQCSQSPIFLWNCLDIARLTRLDCSQSSIFP